MSTKGEATLVVINVSLFGWAVFLSHVESFWFISWMRGSARRRRFLEKRQGRLRLLEDLELVEMCQIRLFRGARSLFA